MKVSQVAEFVNEATKQACGLENVINENLDNVVEAGTAIFDNTSYDNFVRSLVDHIGRVIFVDRTYTGNTLAIKRDSWQYGAVLEKISAGMIPATESETWQLEDGVSVDPNLVTLPTVQAKFYDTRVCFEIPITIADKQVKSAFSSASQLNGFVSMIYGMVDKSMQLKLEELSSRVVNSFILSTVATEFPSVSDNNYSNSTGVKAINLLKLYNTDYGLTGTDALTKDNCMLSPAFIKYATLQIDKTLSRMTRMSNLFNIGGQPRFTPRDLQHVILLSDFKAASDVMLNSGVFNKELTQLPKATEVPFWQGSGTGYALSSVSNIHGTVGNKEISLGYVLGCAFDDEACMLACLDERTTSNYNPKGEYLNTWRKVDCGLFRDENENFVVWFIA